MFEQIVNVMLNVYDIINTQKKTYINKYMYIFMCIYHMYKYMCDCFVQKIDEKDEMDSDDGEANNNSAMKKRAVGAIVVIWARNKHLSFVVPPVLATYNNNNKNTNGTAHLGIHASSKPLPLIDIKSKPKSNQKLRSLFLQQIRVANASRQKPLLSGVVVITTIIDGTL
ncbi:hypothetical protein RFI_38702 [Reticulomyxa filosa]|uniref:Uncharacterized protein n=1 Tax=Reticulomyxa filosa TaxID=46433 RepID=X6LBN7_RETFI|nr:hypothetical protein RFI_38702 [Reticulomyxa filosa]|eukprot:ETN98785.1 hypothetical protein RFI_38702 [Reticulomyxa filosa]